MGAPTLDGRTRADIVAQTRALMAQYVPAWKPAAGDPGWAVVQVFARYLEILLEKLNLVPQKNLLAFLDLIGVSLLPPTPARVPLQFFPVAGATQGATVQQGTPVATGGEPALIFETEATLSVTTARLLRLVTHDPAADRYRNHAVSAGPSDALGSPAYAFAGDTLIEHTAYLAHGTLLSISHPTEITLRLKLERYAQAASALLQTLTWWAPTGDGPAQLPATTSTTGRTARVTLTVPAGCAIPESAVDGTSDSWIWATTSLPLAQNNLLELSDISLLTRLVEPLGADLAFTNVTPVDLTKGGAFVFGERPRVGDCFYIGSDEVFSKAGALVTLTLTLEFPIKPSPDLLPAVTVAWEYWNEPTRSWLLLGSSSYDPNSTTAPSVVSPTNGSQFDEQSMALTRSGTSTVVFKCPDIRSSSVNSKEKHWIRVRLASGSYGQDASLSGTGSTLTYNPPTFRPPFVTNVSLGYEYRDEQPMARIVSYNDFHYRVLRSPSPGARSGAFRPFETPQAVDPAIYLGFDRRFENRPVNLYVGVIESPQPLQGTVVDWEYWDGQRWQPLDTTDDSRGLTRAGIVSFMGPAGMQRSTRFGDDLYWIRARLAQGAESKEVFQLTGIFPNVVWAHNATSISNELLGSSNGQPNQHFRLARSPVNSGQQIEIKEAGRPSAEDIARLEAEGEADPVREVVNRIAKTTDIWVRWHAVDNFHGSKPDSRHYVIERSSGQIRFGDGVQGMIPPPGRDNVRAALYQVGGGRAGNVPARTVAFLKRAVPFVDGATNPFPAGGGADQETLAEVQRRGPRTLKHRDRAISAEDYEWLAREASVQVARTLCIPAADGSDAGRVTVLLVPDSDDPAPYPPPGLVRDVERYLDERRPPTVALRIAGPEYVTVSVSVTIVPTSLDEAELTRARVQARLVEFLHPLTGGPQGEGWDFGRDVYVSEIAQVVEDTEGVDHVAALRISGALGDDDRTREGGTRVEVMDDRGELVASGTHTVVMSGA